MVDQVLKDVRRIVAPNPGPLTHKGTNTYIMGKAAQVIIDPGPDDDRHLKAILDAAPNIVAILVTHSHLDHSALAPRLAQATGATTYGYGPWHAGRSHRRDLGPDFPEGDGTDYDFIPDTIVENGAGVIVAGVHITAHWTPGHFSNHLCYATGNVLFSGDAVMDWASTMISLPEGSVKDFMGTCNRLQNLKPKVYLPGHGAPLKDGKARAKELAEHRKSRARELKAALLQAPGTAEDLARRIYENLDPSLWPAAERTILAHLIPMYEAGNVLAKGPLHPKQIFTLKQ